MNLSRVKRIASRVGRIPAVASAIAAQKRYGADGAGLLAGALTYYGFLSLFPLMLLALSVLGFVLAAHPALHTEIADRVTTSIPGLGAVVGDQLGGVESSRAGTGVVGLLGLAWSGTGIVAAAQESLARVFGLTLEHGWKAKLRRFAVLALLGTIALVSTALTAAAGGARGSSAEGIALRIAGLAVSLVADVGLFLASYRILTHGRCPSLRRLLPGAVFAGIGWTALKFAGAWYATRTVANARAVYGTFAATVGVLVLLYLGARLFLYGAELIAVTNEGGSHGRTRDDRRHRLHARVA